MRDALSSQALLIGGLTCFLFAAVGQASQGPRLPAITALPAEVQYDIEGGALTVEAGLGPGPSFRAVIDTGMRDCIVSTRLAKERGLSGSGEVVIASPVGHIRAVPAGVHSIRLGQVVIDGVPLCIADPIAQLSSAAADSARSGPDAWLGNGVLSLMVFETDPSRKRLVLAPPDSAPMRGGTPVPMDAARGRLEVRARANNAEDFTAILATGVRGCLIPAAVARSLKLALGPERSVALPGGEAVRVAGAMLKELRFGSAKIHDVPVLAALDEIPGLTDRTGVVGTDALMRFRIQISYARQQAVFAAVSGAKPERQSRSERPTVQRRPSLPAPERGPRGM